jgi:hypothetical protein
MDRQAQRGTYRRGARPRERSNPSSRHVIPSLIPLPMTLGRNASVVAPFVMDAIGTV